jgi:hypothetical protein
MSIRNFEWVKNASPTSNAALLIVTPLLSVDNSGRGRIFEGESKSALREEAVR